MLGAGRLSLPSSPSQLRVGLGGGDGHAVSRGFAGASKPVQTKVRGNGPRGIVESWLPTWTDLLLALFFLHVRALLAARRTSSAVRSPSHLASPATKMLLLFAVSVAGVGRLPESVYVDGGNVRYFAFGSNLLRSKMVGCAAPTTLSSQRPDD
jgi:hypothetical protein